MGIRTAAWLMGFALAGPIAAADDPSVPLSTLASGDQVRLQLGAAGKSLRGPSRA